jgi:nucleoside phosphorylase
VAERVWDSERYPLRLVLTGIGKVLASWGLASHAAGARRLLSLGTSGGLGGEAVGSLWLVSEFVEHDFNLVGLGLAPGVTPWEGMEEPVMRTAGQRFLDQARRAARLARLEPGECRSATGDEFVSDSGRARELARRTGARLIDMESGALAKLVLLRAGRTGPEGGRETPELLALRYVSDNADHQAHRSWKEEVRAASVDLSSFLLAYIGLVESEGMGPG